MKHRWAQFTSFESGCIGGKFTEQNVELFVVLSNSVWDGPSSNGKFFSSELSFTIKRSPGGYSKPCNFCLA